MLQCSRNYWCTYVKMNVIVHFGTSLYIPRSPMGTTKPQVEKKNYNYGNLAHNNRRSYSSGYGSLICANIHCATSRYMCET
jgi:hypothetical protein